jgi:small subunit ribosomal protein S6
VSERIYEILFIADPNLGEAEVEALVTLVQGYVEKEGAKVQRVERWGKKRLAYVVRKQREGYYVLIVAEGKGGVLKDVDRRLRVTDGVLKFIIVRVDEELRKADGRRARRAKNDSKKRERRPAPPAVAEPEEVEL